jgi:hypothetical protein
METGPVQARFLLGQAKETRGLAEAGLPRGLAPAPPAPEGENRQSKI